MGSVWALLAAALLLVQPPSYGRALERADEAMSLGRWSDAIRHLAPVVRQQPDDPEAQLQYGLALQRAGRTREAIAHLEQAIDLLPPDDWSRRSTALWELALAYEAEGNCPEAAATWIRYLTESTRSGTPDPHSEQVARDHIQSCIPRAR